MTRDNNEPPPITLPYVNAKSHTDNDSLATEIISAMAKAGVCVVRNMFDTITTEKVIEDVRPHIADAGNYTGCAPTSKTVTALLSKSDTFALNIVGHPVFHTVIDHFLTNELHPRQPVSGQCKPQLDASFCVCIGPHGEGQDLHRDDIDRMHWLSGANQYKLGRDLGVAMLTALTPTTRDNGATVVLPGSHLWNYEDVLPDHADPRLVTPELQPGDSLLLLSSTLHAGGSNVTEDTRMVAVCFAARAHLKQLENQYLAHDLDKVRKFPVWLQRFMGYTLTQPYCGWVDKKDPLRIINPKAEEFLDGWNLL
ncbi:Dioxygenase cnsJ [Penicillium lividum]|nr:Dioxygenase cnsJ [Penicillium lividum]